MTVTALEKDPETLTMVVTTEFDATPDRVWQLWADPRQLERWWGPPTYPATVTAHDLTVGGRVEYYLTGPDGDQPRSYWDILAVEPPHHLAFRDGFANDDGSPSHELPFVETHVTIERTADGPTRMSVECRFPSSEAMDELLAMGMEAGLKQAIGQIDAILAERAAAAR